MRRSIVFFDLDGTLSDTMPQLVELFVRLYAEHFGMPEDLSRERVPELLKLGRPEVMEEFAELSGGGFSPQSQLVIRYREQLNAGVGNLPVVLFPEVADVLRRLCEQDYRLVLTTNSPVASLDDRLTAANIRHHFTLVLGNDPSGISKGPAHIKHAQQALGLTPEDLARQAVLVGDSDSDMAMAMGAGLVAIGRVTNDNGATLRAAGAHHLINDLLELETLLGELAAQDIAEASTSRPDRASSLAPKDRETRVPLKFTQRKAEEVPSPTSTGKLNQDLVAIKNEMAKLASGMILEIETGNISTVRGTKTLVTKASKELGTTWKHWSVGSKVFAAPVHAPGRRRRPKQA